MCPLLPAGVGPTHESLFCDARAIQSRKGGVMHKGWKDAPIWPRGTKKGGEICTVPLSTGSKVAPSIAGCTNSHNAIFVVWRAQWLSVHSNFPDYHRAPNSKIPEQSAFLTRARTTCGSGKVVYLGKFPLTFSLPLIVGY